MEKIKERLAQTRSKVIVGVIAILVIGASAVVYAVSNNTIDPKPEIIFKENIVLEYGQKIKEEKKTDKVDKDALPILKVEDLVDVEKSIYDEISFEKIGDGQTFETKPVTVDTSAIGSKEATIFARIGEVVEVFTFKYEVKDTKAPLLDFVKDVEIKEGSEFELEFKARDIVDGELPITINGEYDVNKAGVYDLKASAVDKHANKTEQAFKLTVKAKDSSEVTESSDDDVAVKPTDDGWKPTHDGSNESSGNSNGGGGGGTSTPDPIPEKPEPILPTAPDEEDEGIPGMFIFRDYGSFEGCSEVIYETLEEHIWDWKRNFCDADGVMWYEPN